jgi:hypothetical protein
MVEIRTVFLKCETIQLNLLPEFKSPITEAARSKARNVFSFPNTGIVVSNPSGDMDICPRLFCICVVLYKQRPFATGLISRPSSPTNFV